MFNGNFSWSRSIEEIKKNILPSYQSYTECLFFITFCSMHLSVPFLMAISVNVKCQILVKIDLGRRIWYSHIPYFQQLWLQQTASTQRTQSTVLCLCHTECTDGPFCNWSYLRDFSKLCSLSPFPFQWWKALCPISFAFSPLLPVIWL